MPDFTLLAPTHVAGVALGELAGPGVRVRKRDAATCLTGVSVSSREIRPGGLFAALPGLHQHGAQFAEAARTVGAVAVLTDAAGAHVARRSGLPVAVATDPRLVLGPIAARVYGTDRVVPRLFGVTGTNGKTTTIHLLDALLERFGARAGCSSTEHRRSGAAVVASRLTSPEAPELHALLARMNEDGTEAAAIEVTAQAMTNHRTGGLVFDVVGFTNLSHDHLDQYRSMADYLAAKVALFQPGRARTGVVSLDSAAGVAVVERAGIGVTTITSTPGVAADWTVHDIAMTSVSTRFELSGPAGQHLATTIPLVGRHMAADCGLALVMLASAGYDVDRMGATVAAGVDVVVAGRTQLVSGAIGPRVYLDFSHTPDSTEKALAALRETARGPVIVLLGADGDKDPTKRGPMGAAAARGADVVIITDHHSRWEDPAAIRHGLLAGARAASAPSTVLEIADSPRAIRRAVELAGPDGTVLWVGPGSVDYRVIAGRDVPYSPRRDTARALTDAGWAVDGTDLVSSAART